MSQYNNIQNKEIDNLRRNFFKYLSFWPLIAVSVLISMMSFFIYIRYTDQIFDITTKIQILDPGKDNEMALPTAMTIFNRSLVNLENETGVLTSYDLHEAIVKKIQYNIQFFKSGTIKTSRVHKSDFFKEFDFKTNEKINLYAEKQVFDIKIENEQLLIYHFDQDEKLINNYTFDNLSTSSLENDLPFSLDVKNYDNFENGQIIIFPLPIISNLMRSAIDVSPVGIESDQILIKYAYPNKKLAIEYLSNLINEYDMMGITERQLEYKRTIDFVDSRSVILRKDLEEIEITKQNYKEDNLLTDIQVNATTNLSQYYDFDLKLFESETQKRLSILLKESLQQNEYELMPINIGLNDVTINELILDYNKVVREREKYLITSGSNNPFLINLNEQIVNLSSTIISSLDNYISGLNISIEKIKNKGNEYNDFSKSIPEKEKILRSINRELEIKEALFLLLLQKKEEAAINFAVVKPAIKVIDYPRSTLKPVYPNLILSFLIFAVVGFFTPIFIIFIIFSFDNKIHTRADLESLTMSKIPIISEIPYVRNKEDLENIIEKNSSNILSESLRILVSNLNYSFINGLEKKAKTILVTSSVKGEGKTLISVNTAKLLSDKNKKTVLIGADLRNPQIHKFLNLNKSSTGLSDYLSSDKINYDDIIIKEENLDILLSGNIPPNPDELLSSDKFKELVKSLKKKYEYILIDSAPSLVVSDTKQISVLADSTLYVVRANYTAKAIVDFINDNHRNNKFNKLNLVLNSVGENISSKYGYQYGYGYSYNYSYGYGYSSKK